MSNFEVYFHTPNGISQTGVFETFDKAINSFFTVSSQWAKIIINVESKTCVKAYGGAPWVEELKNLNNVSTTRLGGDSNKYEIYWHVEGNIQHNVSNSYDAALERWEAVGTQWAKILVNTKTNKCEREYGGRQYVQELKNITYCL